MIISGQPYDNHSNRRELRRPMGGDEDLARGMARMDPFAYGGGGNGGTGGRYGMQNQFDPPRPAPNADGWSSGDDYLAWNDQSGGGQEVQQGYGSGGQGQPGQQVSSLSLTLTLTPVLTLTLTLSLTQNPNPNP